MGDATTIDGVDYGPLAPLIGNWKGDKGIDIAPEPDGHEENPYFETILFEAVGSVTNADTQTLAALRYHQVVSRKSDGKVFHNQTGYWSWDAAKRIIMQSLTIPRGVCLLAGNKMDPPQDASHVAIEVSAAEDDDEWHIIQSPFMAEKARTKAFRHQLAVSNNELSYSETTTLEIYGKTFDHTDGNILVRCD